jgi:hypothetical protein
MLIAKMPYVIASEATQGRVAAGCNNRRPQPGGPWIASARNDEDGAMKPAIWFLYSLTPT